jgi:hypothetical protein
MSEQSEELERLTEQSAAYPPEGLVTVAEFAEPVSANMARMALDSVGITSFLQGENANSLIPPAFAARLQVRPEDEAVARGTDGGAREHGGCDRGGDRGRAETTLTLTVARSARS